ncbi:putative iSRs2 transposase [Mycobacterium xenopi 3993]|nr:putative iSRs2 transposase [Mycobacterium xenopi 3993]
MAETTIGLYKTECVRAGSPFRTGPIRTLADLENITSAWVHWYNTARLMHRLGRRRQPKPRPSTTPGCKPATPSAVRRLGSRRGVTQHRWQTRDLWRSC